MSFGIELLNETSRSIIANSENVFIVDYITLGVGQFSKTYTLAPGETLYASAIFNKTSSQTNPHITYLQVSGNNVSWGGSNAPSVYPVTSLIIYKKGNISSLPATNTYGAEFTSNTGNLFVVSDANPFTYFNNYTLDGSTGAKEVNTGIPSDSRVMVFRNKLSGSASAWNLDVDHYIKNGTWHISVNAVSAVVQIFVFADREHKDVRGNSNYGFEFYDKNGNLVIGNNSRPLKLYSYSPPYFDNMWDLGFQTFSLRAVNLLYPHSYNPYVSDNGGYGSSISESTRWITGYYKPICDGANEISVGSTNFPTDFLYIKASDYI